MATDIHKYKPTQKILDKLEGYRSKGSKVNVKAITNRDKLFTYFYAAKLMGWNDLASDISSSVSILDKEADEIFKEIRAAVKADTSLGDARTPDQKKLWARFKNIAQFLADNNLSYTFASRPPFRQELDGDMRNGRCYTIAYTLEIEGSLKLYMANHTNEGGGTYGYSTGGFYMPTSKKECEDRIIGQITHWLNNRPGNTVTEEVKLSEALRPGYFADRIFSILDDLSVEQIERFLHEYAAWRDFDAGNIRDTYDRIGAYLETSPGQQLFGDLCNYFEIDEITTESLASTLKEDTKNGTNFAKEFKLYESLF